MSGIQLYAMNRTMLLKLVHLPLYECYNYK
jgi:hypothetical protein